jgi:hypothetical protein
MDYFEYDDAPVASSPNVDTDIQDWQFLSLSRFGDKRVNSRDPLPALSMPVKPRRLPSYVAPKTRQSTMPVRRRYIEGHV